jgi:hypothetical protein
MTPTDVGRITFRRYTSLPPSTQALVEGIAPSAQNIYPYPSKEDFKGYPYIIWDGKNQKTKRYLSDEEYHNIFDGELEGIMKP